jgi:hypothetical protein
MSGIGIFKKKMTFYKTLEAPIDALGMKNLWRDIITDYSRKKLTKESDIFPAVAGFAKRMEDIRKSRYLAGLWEDSLNTDLLWSAADTHSNGIGYRYPQPTSWRAPSWSWASTTSPVNWYALGYNSAEGSLVSAQHDINDFVSDLEANCVPIHGEDLTMGLTYASLTLQGTLCDIRDIFDGGENIQISNKENEDGSELNHVILDYAIGEPPLQRLLSLGVKCLLYGSSDTIYGATSFKISFYYLVLVPKNEPNCYERIGMIRHAKRVESCAERSKITIL